MWGTMIFSRILLSLLILIALPPALLLKLKEAMLQHRSGSKKCPRCAELVKADAETCRFCNHSLIGLWWERGESKK